MRKTIDLDKAIKMYNDQMLSSTVVAKTIGCSVQTLINRLRENNIKIRPNGWDKQKISLDILRHEYENLKMSTKQIATKHNMSQPSIFERLIKNGVKMRDRKEAASQANTKISIAAHHKICQRYLNNPAENASSIAKDYGVHKTTIHNILKNYGIYLNHSGPRNNKWKGGITPIHNRIRNCDKAKEWKNICMKRDDYTCQICQNKGGKLHIHHKEMFSNIFDRFLKLNEELSEDQLFELALNYRPFWDIDNGITLCVNCHNKLHDKSASIEMRRKTPKKNIDIDKAIELYNSGMTATAVAKEVGTVASVLLRRLRERNIKIRHFSSYKNGCASTDQICHEYKSLEMTTTQIAEKYGVTRSAIQKRLLKADIKLRNAWEERRKNQKQPPIHCPA